MFFSPSVLGFLGIRFQGVPKSELYPWAQMGLDGTHHREQARIEPQKAHRSLELRLSSFVLFYPCISLMSVCTSSYVCFP